jgi:arsenite methyltransferase
MLPIRRQIDLIRLQGRISMTTDAIVDQVQSKYAAFAASGLSGAREGIRLVAEAFGYTPEELASIPAEANMGLSCGNPVTTAHLRPGEVVVDLGCGAGLDVLLASQRIGPTGKAIGIDMTPEMIDRARRNAVRFGNGATPANVEFHLARIDELPLPDRSVDCLISNCVINLAPDKSAVFRAMYRVLKPGGRVAVSDIALKQPLPPEVGQDILAYVGCIAGAILIHDYDRALKDAGFAAVEILDTGKDLNVYQLGNSGCCGSRDETRSTALPLAETPSPAASLHASLAELLSRYDINQYAASVQVFALKT